MRAGKFITKIEANAKGNLSKQNEFNIGIFKKTPIHLDTFCTTFAALG
jgi:hypothetical protein